MDQDRLLSPWRPKPVPGFPGPSAAPFAPSSRKQAALDGHFFCRDYFSSISSYRWFVCLRTGVCFGTTSFVENTSLFFCWYFFRRGSFRLGYAVAELPLLSRLRPPWINVSIVRILLHLSSQDQPPHPRKPRPPRSGSQVSPGSSIDPVSSVPTQHATDAATPAPPSLGALPPETLECHHPSRSSRDVMIGRNRVHRVCRAILAHR